MASVAEATMRRCASGNWPFLTLPKDSNDRKEYAQVLKQVGVNINRVKQRRGKNDVLPGPVVRSAVTKFDKKRA